MHKYLFLKTAIHFLGLTYFLSQVNGLTYDHFSEGRFTSVHVLIVNPKEHTILPVKAEGKIARETVSTLVNRFGASAGINGGFWKLNGKPAGVLKINQEWYGVSTKPRGAIGWSSDGQTVYIDRIVVHPLYKDADEMKVIPVSDFPHVTSEQWKALDYIVGGTPILVKKGKLVENYYKEQVLKYFLTKRLPRTAVGIKENGDWVFVVVDGSFKGFLGGMTIKQLAKLMLQLGCVDALNLDGGGSSTMVLEGNVINNPSGSFLEKSKSVEKVSDAILIFPK